MWFHLSSCTQGGGREMCRAQVSQVISKASPPAEQAVSHCLHPAELAPAAESSLVPPVKDAEEKPQSGMSGSGARLQLPQCGRVDEPVYKVWHEIHLHPLHKLRYIPFYIT